MAKKVLISIILVQFFANSCFTKLKNGLEIQKIIFRVLKVEQEILGLDQ